VIKEVARLEWLDRITEVIDTIEQRLTEHLDVEDVAKSTYSSPFHFQRMFHVLTGVTVAEYIRKRRLTLAAQELVMSADRVVDIALKYGYESPESFAKAFRKAHGISPSEARAQGAVLKAFPRISFHLALKGDKEMDYKIVHRDAFHVIGKSIRVSYKEGENLGYIPQFWDNCIADGMVERLRSLRPDGELLGICMDRDYDNEEFTYAVAAEADMPVSDGLVKFQIPASTWAVFAVTGALPHAVQEITKRIFEEWFPGTTYQHTGGPELEVYPPGHRLSEEYEFEVWIPVVKN
jgi:AraC family transcriptional regulator